jgi:two-component system, OmpR family, phosphate regulon sensor histidine kinase PhoR
MTAFWRRPLLFTAGLALLAILGYAYQGAVGGLLIFCLGMLGYLAHHLWLLSRLHGWLNQPGASGTLRAGGAWGEIFGLLGQQSSQRSDSQQRSAADLEQMLAATRSLPDSVIILDAEARILWLNDAAAAHLGLARGRDEGHFINYLLRASQFTEWLHQEDYSQPLLISSPLHPEMRLSLRIVPMPRTQRMLIAQDVTEMQRVEVMRRDFVANVSHELRTPITVIAGFLEAFDDMPEPDPAEFKKHVHLMYEQTERMRHLLDDLLTLARLESDPALHNEAIDVCALAARLLGEARSLSQGQHDISLDCLTGARLIGNAQELQSALGNLVVNAVRYTPGPGHIKLIWRATERGGAEFAVVDSGEGIAAQHIPRLTERFYRVDRGRSRASGGTGLGLAIVKHILQRHQSRLRIDSTVGKGSTFSAIFPADRVIPADAAPALPADPA